MGAAGFAAQGLPALASGFTVDWALGAHGLAACAMAVTGIAETRPPTAMAAASESSDLCKVFIVVSPSLVKGS